MKRLLVLGSGGMTGSEVSERASPFGWKVRPLSHADLDITDAAAVDDAVKEFHPYVVINCAAYTAVDEAESEPEKAQAINADGARNVARSAHHAGAAIIHVSTDYVFDGKARKPYGVDARTSPLCVYGKTKLAGEAAVKEENPAHVIVRTSWVFSHRGTNFVRTMLRLGGEKDEVKVVNDQTGRPTCAADLAEALLTVADAMFRDKPVAATYHFANAGETTWFDFAKAIFEEAALAGLSKSPRLLPISTREFPTKAARPAYSVLETSAFEKDFRVAPRPWITPLRETIGQSLDTSLSVNA
jgi:dTDP-4-dehydrorhamnose reductase